MSRDSCSRESNWKFRGTRERVAWFKKFGFYKTLELSGRAFVMRERIERQNARVLKEIFSYHMYRSSLISIHFVQVQLP